MEEKFGILPALNKDFILSKITQEQIFEYYLQIKVETGNLMKTPNVIRPDDNDPTFSFYYNDNGKLRARDWAGYFHGDCFDIVAYILHINASDKKSFMVLLDRIARDFRLHKYSDTNMIYSGLTIDTRENTPKIKARTVIQFQPRGWNLIDKDFWLAGNVNSKLLEHGKVYAAQYLWVNSQLVYTFVPKDPCYVYFFKQNDIKAYFPKRDNYRFLSNTSYLQGIDIIEPDEIGLITKSYKDVLSLKSFNISSIAPSSETVPISKEQWNTVKHYCNHWFSLMDFDRTGILMARKLRDLYGIQPLFFSNYKPLNKKLRDKNGAYLGINLAKNYEMFPTVKDFYDYTKAYGKESTLKLINTTKEIYNERFEQYDKEMYNNLNWIKYAS